MNFSKKPAALDYPLALYRLGDFHCNGKAGLIPDSRKAVEYLTRAAELGESEAYKLLSEIYLHHTDGIEADGYKVIDNLLKYTEAKQLQPSEAKDPFTKNIIQEEINCSFNTAADICLYGKCGVNPDGYKAIEYYTKSNWDWAWSKIAEIYEAGCGDIAPNRDEVIEFYKKSSSDFELKELTKPVENLQELISLADSGDAKALYELTDVYLKGRGGVEQSPEKALELLERAVAQNYPPALERLGNFYLYGKCTVKQDGNKALELFKRADELIANDAELDDDFEPDYEFFARIYREGIGGVKQDGAKVLDYLIRDFEENPRWETEHEILQICFYGCGGLKLDWRKAFEFMKVPPDGGLQVDADNLAFKFACVFDDERGYFRKDGDLTLQVLEDRAKRLEELKAPDIVRANELRRIAEIYEAGYGGLEPSRDKAIETYKKFLAFLPHDKIFRRRLADLTGSNEE